MKKSMPFLMTSILTISLALTGCNNDNVSGSDDKTVVDVFNIKVETKKELDKLVEEYEKHHSDVAINVTTVGGGQDAPAALQAKFSSGEEPAIFMLGGINDVDKYEDTLLDLSDLKATELAIDGTLEGATKGGIPLGIPYNIEGFSWLINTEMAKKAGVDIEKIKSYADFEVAVKAIDAKKDELGLDAVFGFSGKENWVVSQFSSHFTAAAYNNSLIETAEGDTPNFKYFDRFKDYTDLFNKYTLQPVVNIDYSTSVEEKFANGKVAIIHQGNWIVPTLDSIDETFSQEKMDIVPMFIDDENPNGTVAAGPSWYWGINKKKDEKVVEASKDFLDWMYTSDEGKKSLIEDFKYIPAYEGNNPEDIADTVSKTIYEKLSNKETTVWANGSYPNGWFSSSLHPEYQKYLSGDITWDKFKSSIEKSWNELKNN